MLEAMGTGKGGVPGGDGSGRSEGSECGEHRRHRILAGRPQRFMPRDPTRLIPATRNGGGGGGEGEEATARESGYHAPRMDRITASLGSIWLRGDDDDKGGGLGETGSGRGRGEDDARGDARCGLAVGAARGRFGVSLILLFSAPDMWVRIVGPQYAVRWYWDQETDKRGWFYSGVRILFLKSYWRRLYDR